MSELPITPFPPPAGLTLVGGEDGAVCVDGVCAVPDEQAGEPTPGEQSED